MKTHLPVSEYAIVRTIHTDLRMDMFACVSVFIFFNSIPPSLVG